ncbi:hypothetical protein [Bradyrhizobium sp. SZCCHNRI1009]|uniref:hypothetical protein n=1 Tax=Bradyrhizobium TaxID=374 RepID=UPI002916FB1A|nr:hypothetical protein [Bradyrhizobium sp. SZCCHNRI1009]
MRRVSNHEARYARQSRGTTAHAISRRVTAHAQHHHLHNLKQHRVDPGTSTHLLATQSAPE